MTAPFDPYHEWLGISPDEQPADHYRLLGLRRFEPDSSVIDNAAARQLSHLRLFQSGQRGLESQRLLNEVARARICLLDARARSQYDQRLLEAERSIVEPDLDRSRRFSEAYSDRPGPRTTTAVPSFVPEPETNLGARPTTTGARPRVVRRKPGGRSLPFESFKVAVGGLAGVLLAIVILKIGFDIDLVGLLGQTNHDTSSAHSPTLEDLAVSEASVTATREPVADQWPTPSAPPASAAPGGGGQRASSSSVGSRTPTGPVAAVRSDRDLSEQFDETEPDALFGGLDEDPPLDSPGAPADDESRDHDLVVYRGLHFQGRWNVVVHDAWNEVDRPGLPRYRIRIDEDRSQLGPYFDSDQTELSGNGSLTIRFREAEELRLILESRTTGTTCSLRYGLVFEHPNFKSEVSASRLATLRRNWERDIGKLQRDLVRDQAGLAGAQRELAAAQKLPSREILGARIRAAAIAGEETRVASYQKKLATHQQRLRFLQERLASLPVLEGQFKSLNNNVTLRIEQFLVDNESAGGEPAGDDSWDDEPMDGELADDEPTDDELADDELADDAGRPGSLPPGGGGRRRNR